MDVVAILSEIQKCRLYVQADEGNLNVYPRKNITESIRQTIRTEKENLLNFLETYDERAAIIEFEAGYERKTAEEMAFQDITKGRKNDTK